MNSKIFRIVSVVILIMCMVTIFLFSNENRDKSTSTSVNVTREIVGTVSSSSNANRIAFDYFNVIRKSAHFLEYFMLGILVINIISCYKVTNYKWIIASILLCMLYSVSDEVHQMYVPGRSCEVRDVIIDTIGSSTGIMFYYLISKKRRTKNI